MDGCNATRPRRWRANSHDGFRSDKDRQHEDRGRLANISWQLDFNHPDPEAQFILASGLVRFLDIYGHSAGLSPECRNATREIAVELAAATAIFNPGIRLAGERFAEQERLETLEEQRRPEAKRIEQQLRNAELLSRARHSGNRQPERPTESKPRDTAGLVSKAEAYTHAIELFEPSALR